MKNSFFTILITLISYNTISQNKESFEGIIIYKNTFESKIDTISSTSFENAYGKQTKYILSKKGDYINLFKGSYITIQLFKNKEKRLYTVLTGRDTIFYNNILEKTGKITAIKKNSEKHFVLNKNCSQLSFKLNNSLYKYYYNNDYFIDPKLYSNHNLGNWNEIVEITKSFPLKIIMETNYFTMTSTAIQVKKGPVSQKLFSLPPNIPVAKAEKNLFVK